MNWSRIRLKEMARIALQGSYWKCVLVNLILTIAVVGIGGGSNFSNVRKSVQSGMNGSLPDFSFYDFGGFLFSGVFALIFLIGVISALAVGIFVFLPLEVSCANFFREDLYRPVNLDTLKAGFSPNYWNVVKTQFLRRLYIWLWTLLLVIPGIVKSYEYMMMPYIMAEHPEMATEEVFYLSKQMMDGEKWNAFVLDLSFLGWELLSGITGGLVGIFYCGPYKNLTHAALYGALKQKMQMQGSYSQPNIW